MLLRSDLNLKVMLNKVKVARVRAGKDDRFLSDRRLTLAISRVPNLPKILIDSNMEEEFDISKNVKRRKK